MTRPTPLAALVPALTAALAAGSAAADDTGDAPDSYGAASHGTVAGAPFLGETVPDDNDPVAGIAADGDDIAGGDDEDGVFAFPTLVQNGKAYTTNVFASNPSGSAATLRGWVDFDGDGAFGADESASLPVPAGADDEKFKLRWNDLEGITTEFTGETYARFRITSDALVAGDAAGFKTDGEVEDYTVVVEPDVDGDEVPDAADLDNDNDGIPDTVEVVGVDTDADGTPDYLDGDADGDGVPDFAEVDADNDGIPDALERGDGEAPVDTDADGVPDFLDLDSDNDGLADLVEGGGAGLDPAEVDADGDGRVDDGLAVGENGYLDDFETDPESGTPGFAIVDTDADGARDYVDLDSDGDGTNDVVEVGLDDDDADGRVNGFADSDGDGVADALDDADGDGFADGADSRAVPPTADTDDDGVPDVRDADAVGGPVAPGTGAGDGDGDGAEGDEVAQGDADGDGGEGDGAEDGAGDPTSGGDGGDGGGATGTPGTATGGTADDDASDGGAGTGDDEPAEDDASGSGEVLTGLDGGTGCSIASTSGSPDPLFALLLGGAGAWLARRRRGGAVVPAATPTRRRGVPETTV